MHHPAKRAATRRALAAWVAVLAGLGFGAAGAETPTRGLKALVHDSQNGTVRTLESLGARRVAQRGSLLVYELDPNRSTAAAALPGVVLRPDFATVRLNRRTVDTLNPDASRSAGVYAPVDFQRPLKLVQFAAPPTQAELDELEAKGARIVHYVPQNAYIVWTENAAPLVSMEREGKLQFVGNLHPDDSVSPRLDEAARSGADLPVTIQLFAGADSAKADLALIESVAGGIIEPAREALGGKYINVTVRMAAEALPQVASLGSTVWVEEFIEPELFDERQGIIMVGNITAGGAPTAPGYLDWMASKGFPQTPASYPVVVVVDDGVDNGTTTPANSEFREFNNPGNPSRITFATVPPGSAATSAAGPDGHGNLNASIVGGYNAGTGPAVEDTAGFNYGLGISPFGRVANSRIFSPNFDIGTGTATLVADYYNDGARISTNSWGSNAGGAYTTRSQEYDRVVRDADPAAPGNQELSILFAAGNSGPGGNTIGAPGTGKNITCVGASETSNPAASAGDGCDLVGSDGDNARDLASFSSRGPTDDGRRKPDIVAPGTFIQGAASQPTFNGSSVCGAASNDFGGSGADALFPPGSAYTWSSGTSHSTPAIAGYKSLIWEFLGRTYGISSPSPALLKAYVIHSGSQISGSGDGLGGNSQGFGLANMGMGFSTQAPRVFVNQETVFTEPGEEIVLLGSVANPSEPVRIAMVFTDVPGATSGAAYVNDLDLTVTYNGETYFGNRLSGGESVTGGAPDPINNAEVVFLPPGAGQMSIRVSATTLAGDGVPGTGDATDQDFALVVYNFSQEPTPALIGTGNNTFDDNGIGNADGILDPGESGVDVTIEIKNGGTLGATGVTGRLVSLTPTVLVTQADASYGDLDIDATATNSVPYEISLSADHPCGAPVLLRLELASNETVGKVRLSFPTGQPGALNTETTASSNVPVTISDNTIQQSTLDIALTGPVTDVNVRGLNITHTYTGDLDISLRSPSGTVVELSTDNGGSGDNYINTDFDDSASTPITAGTAPFTGVFRPEGSLAAFNGEEANGTWTLIIADDAGGDTGTLTSWSLEISSQEILCTPAAAPQFADAGGASFDDSTGNGNGDGILDPGEDTILFTLPITNIGSANATNCTATLVSLTDRLTVVDGTASYGDVDAGNTASNATPFTVALNGGHPCGKPIRMRLNVTSDEGFGFIEYEFATGNNIGSGTLTEPAAGLPAPINDNTVAESTISVAANGTVTGVRVVGLNITHTFTGDLDLSLRSPSGTVIVLSSDNGGAGDNYTNTTFDDAAATSITAGTAPFTGSFRPEEPLATFIGEPVNGDWTLIYADDAGGDTGTLNAWSIELSYEEIVCSQITLPSVAFRSATSTTTERDGNFAIEVGLDFATVGVDGTVDYLVTGGSAVFGTDHTLADGTLTFPAGTETASITVPLLNDFVEDGDQTLEITLANPANVILSATGPITHTLTITDNDPKPTPTETPVPTPSATPSPSATESPTPTPVPDGVFCSTDGPIAIPDNLPAGITSTIVVKDTRVISDLNVDLNMTHTFVGDLIVRLTHVDSGISVELINRPGVPASTFGCGGDNVDATMDDEGTSPVETTCNATPPALAGNLIPNSPLSAFDGMSIEGTWRLTCSDNAALDIGTLVSWCLVATLGGDTPTATPTEAPTATPADTPTATVTPTATNTPTATPTDAPTATATEAPTATPTDEPTATPTDAPTATATVAPTATPTDAATASPTAAPTATATAAPTATATVAPTATPTEAATASPTAAPTATATAAPTATPTDAPTATPTDAPTASPTAEPTATDVPTPSPTPAPDIDFTFDETDEDWAFFPGQNLGSENGQYTSGTLRIRSSNGTGDFGYWESQVITLPSLPVRGEAMPLYRATYLVSTDQASAADVPTIRLRATAPNAAQADVLAIESVGNGEYSPTSGAYRSYDLLFTAAKGMNGVRLAFDLLNYDGFGAPGSSIILDRVTLSSPFYTNAGTLLAEWTDFTTGWDYRTLASGFVSPTGALVDGKPTITSVPFPTGGPTVQFGWWNGPETAAGGAIAVDPDMMYWVEATLRTNATNANDIPSFRIRINETGFRAAKLIQVASNYDEALGEKGAQNVPPVGSVATYRMFLPAGLPAGGVLFPSFDLLTTSEDNDAAGITVTLERLRIYGMSDN